MPILDSISPDQNYYRSSNSCMYEDLNSINNRASNNSCINVLHINIRSCNKFFNELLSYLNSSKPKFHEIILSETWLNLEEEWIEIEDYQAFHSIRKHKKGGGVTVLCDITISPELNDHLSVNNKIF